MDNENRELYLLMNENSDVLARGYLMSEPDAPNMQLKVRDGDADTVVGAELIQAVPIDDDMPLYLGRVIFRRGNLVVLEPIKLLGREVRRNLRVPVVFESFIYPDEGGRHAIVSVNLSCGGIAFETGAELSRGQQMEVVVPITRDGPLIVRCEILRSEVRTSERRFYAAKFVDLINDQETLLRGAVFNVQLHARPMSRPLHTMSR